MQTPPLPVPDAAAASTAEQRHAIAVAVATAAAAEAAVATAQAAVEVARLTRPSSSFVREHCAAVVIQTAFRGYLVRLHTHCGDSPPLYHPTQNLNLFL